jgi:uncharacterized FAD-dependent dehydrogenase
VLTEFVEGGAPEEILYVSKPHIGTFRLVSMVEHMRARSRRWAARSAFQPGRRPPSIDAGRHPPCAACAGQRRRPSRRPRGAGHRPQRARHLRDAACARRARRAKPFSIGFRIEHPQSLIDRARFGPQAGHPLLGAADYKLVHHCGNGRSVYSFCMCPGGTVVAATSEPGRVVTNGMSQYSRNERNANAGIVVGISPEDYAAWRRPAGRHRIAAALGIAGLRAGGGDYSAPAQRVGDFLAGRPPPHSARCSRPTRRAAQADRPVALRCPTT